MYIQKKVLFRDAAAAVVATAALCEYVIHTACTHHCHTARQFCCSRVWYARVTAQCNVLCLLLYTQYSCAADILAVLLLLDAAICVVSRTDARCNTTSAAAGTTTAAAYCQQRTAVTAVAQR
eukprot:20704-Heterococcus_DN1.PRE.3